MVTPSVTLWRPVEQTMLWALMTAAMLQPGCRILAINKELNYAGHELYIRLAGLYYKDIVYYKSCMFYHTCISSNVAIRFSIIILKVSSIFMKIFLYHTSVQLSPKCDFHTLPIHETVKDLPHIEYC